MTLKEYLETAPLRDVAYKLEAAEAGTEEDSRFDELSRLVDQHPVGRLMARVSA